MGIQGLKYWIPYRASLVRNDVEKSIVTLMTNYYNVVAIMNFKNMKQCHIIILSSPHLENAGLALAIASI